MNEKKMYCCLFNNVLRTVFSFTFSYVLSKLGLSTDYMDACQKRKSSHKEPN